MTNVGERTGDLEGLARLCGLPLAIHIADILLEKGWIVELVGSQSQPPEDAPQMSKSSITLGTIVEACLMTKARMKSREDAGLEVEVALKAGSLWTSNVAIRKYSESRGI